MKVIIYVHRLYSQKLIKFNDAGQALEYASILILTQYIGRTQLWYTILINGKRGEHLEKKKVGCQAREDGSEDFNLSFVCTYYAVIQVVPVRHGQKLFL